MNKLNVKYIRICFENVTVSDKLSVGKLNECDVFLLRMYDIASNIHSMFDGLSEIVECQKCALILNPSCNVKWHEWVEETAEPDSDLDLFDRILTHPDIVSIEFIYADGSTKEIYVPWGDADYHNEYQHTKIDSKGRLNIVICKEFDNFLFD